MKERLKIDIKETTEKNVSIIKAYWQIDGEGNLIYRPTEIKEMYNISIPQLRKIISEFSTVTFDKGVCECGENMSVCITSQQALIKEVQDFKSYDLVNLLKCEKCQQKEYEERQQRAIEELQRITDLNTKQENEAKEKLRDALNEERWKSLGEKDFDTLLVIARSKTKGQILSTLLNGITSSNPEWKEIWGRINRLNSLGLIWIKRDYNYNKILDFVMLDELRNSLLKYIREDDVNNLYTELKEDNIDEILPEDTLRFVLQQNGHKLNTRHPNFSGEIKFEKNIVLQRGKSYRYGGWINDDGSIYLKILPAEEPFVDAKEKLNSNASKEKIGFDSFDYDLEVPF